MTLPGYFWDMYTVWSDIVCDFRSNVAMIFDYELLYLLYLLTFLLTYATDIPKIIITGYKMFYVYEWMSEWMNESICVAYSKAACKRLTRLTRTEKNYEANVISS